MHSAGCGAFALHNCSCDMPGCGFFNSLLFSLKFREELNVWLCPLAETTLGAAARASVNIYATHHPDDIHFLGYGHVN
jgi:hypothetical protein